MEGGRGVEGEVEALERENLWLRGEVEAAARLTERRAAAVAARRSLLERAAELGVGGRGSRGRGRGRFGGDGNVEDVASAAPSRAHGAESDFEFISSEED